MLRIASLDDAEPMSMSFLSVRKAGTLGSLARSVRLWSGRAARRKHNSALDSSIARHILNNVKHINRRYYAPILGEFEHLVLLALLRLGNGAYGAAILREIRERTGREVAIGALYMTLGRLEAEEDGLLLRRHSLARARRPAAEALPDRCRRADARWAARIATLRTMAQGIESELEAL